MKIAVARTISAEWVGRLVRLIWGDAILFDGARVASCSPWVSPKVSAQLFWGIYESAERRFVKSFVSPGRPVVELGSSIGGVSSHIACSLESGQKLVCVEANPHLLPVLTKNLKTNASHLQATVVHAAISVVPGTVDFAVSASSLSSHIGERSDATETISAPATTLSKLLSEQKLESEPFQLVMDIEGAEAGIVIDDASSLQHCSRIIAELHETEHRGRAIGVEELISAFVGLGYALEARYGPVVVLERQDSPP